MERRKKLNVERMRDIATSASRLLLPPTPMVETHKEIASTLPVPRKKEVLNSSDIDGFYDDYIKDIRFSIGAEYAQDALSAMNQYELLSLINSAAAHSLFKQAYCIFPELIGGSLDTPGVPISDEHRTVALDVMRAWLLGAAYNRQPDHTQKVKLLHSRTNATHFYTAYNGTATSAQELCGQDQTDGPSVDVSLVFKLTDTLTPADPEYGQMLDTLRISMASYVGPE